MKNNKPIIITIVIAVVVLIVLSICCIGIFFLTQAASFPSGFNGTSQSSTPTLTPTVIVNKNIWDKFDNNQYEWLVGESNNIYADLSREIIGGKYIWTTTSKSDQSLVAIANPNIIIGNKINASFDVFEVDASETVNYNLLFMYTDEYNYYSLRLNQYYQQYSIGKLVDGEWTEWVGWTRDSIINWEDTNNLKVISENNTHKMYINDKLLFTKVDNSLPSGGVSIAIQTYSEGQYGTWEFDNFKYSVE